LPRVSVIIRTQADVARRDLLLRSIDSALEQEGVVVELIVVVNGEQPDSKILEELRGNPRIKTHVLDASDKVRATSVGRSLVTFDFFCYLDDDDEYLPGGLAKRAAFLVAHPTIDCVATNGEYIFPNYRRSVFRRMAVFEPDLAGAMAEGRNWMASCGATYRTATVTQRFFDDTTRHCEFKVIAFRVASELNVELLEDQTYRINDTAHSEVHSFTHSDLEFEIYNAMLRWNADDKRAAVLRRSRTRAFHNACAKHRLAGNFTRAWANHWRSLSTPYGLRYLPYTLLLVARVRRPASELTHLGLGRSKAS
jgi:glycosyltransferase involved in cell wall biosynthesis